MRLIGFSLLVSGFLWIAWDCVDRFTRHQHALWILQTKQLPAGETTPRAVATETMREMGLHLENRHREIFLPAAVMLVGGLLLGCYPKAIAGRAAAPNRGLGREAPPGQKTP
jgi:hypothetical protein